MLDQLKILDFTRLLPGPYATMVLADLGAHVLRIESPSGSDITREYGPKDNNISGYHHHLNRNKRSLTLDLKHQDARNIISKLLEEYDIIIEGFRPGVMERFGLDYETLKEINPKIIYVSITAYGQTGPFSQRAGHDINCLALSGIASYSGSQECGPCNQGIQIADIAGGSMHTVVSVLSAYISRQSTGKGQFIDISMLDTSISLGIFKSVELLVGDTIPTYEDGLLNGGSYYGYYKTKDNRYLAIGGLEPKFYMEMSKALQLPELMELHPVKQADQVRTLLAARIKKKSLEEWTEILDPIDACIEPVLNLDETFNHKHVKSRDLIVDVLHQDDNQRQVGHPVIYSDFSPTYIRVGPKRGNHNKEVMEELGIDIEDIDKNVFG